MAEVRCAGCRRCGFSILGWSDGVHWVQISNLILLVHLPDYMHGLERSSTAILNCSRADTTYKTR